MKKPSLCVDPMEFEQIRVVDIPGICPGMYTVTNFGRMYSMPSKKPIQPSVSKGKCYTVGLVTEPGKSKTFNLDYIVANTFLENPNPDTMTKICHKNNVQSDCHASNLFYADPETYKAYNKYTDSAYEFKHEPKGWKEPKLTEYVPDIRFLYSRGLEIEDIIRVLKIPNISESAVRQAAVGNTFKNID